MNGNTEVLFSGDYQGERSSRAWAPKVVGPFAGSPAVGAGGIVPRGDRVVNFDRRPRNDTRVAGGTVQIDHQFSAFDLVSISAYRESDLKLDLDLDGTDLDFVTNSPRENSRTWSQELRASGEWNEQIEWIAGVFYLREDVEQSFRVRIPALPFDDKTNSRIENDAFGIFAEATIEFLDDFAFTAGARYSWERRENDFAENLNGARILTYVDDDEWNNVSPRFVLEWKPNPLVRVYASATIGFKAGGYNTVVGQPEPFDPETLWAYEVGARAMFFDRRVRVSGAVFFYDYDDIQLNVFTPATVNLFPQVENAGRATVAGGEISTRFYPVKNFELELNLTALHTEIGKLRAVDQNEPAANPDRSGNRLPRAPTLSFFTAAQYTFSFASVELTPRVEYMYRSKIYFSVFQDETTREAAYGILNARLNISVPDVGMELGFFARNLTDTLYAQNRVRLDGQVGNLAFWGEPRFFGFEATFNY